MLQALGAPEAELGDGSVAVSVSASAPAAASAANFVERFPSCAQVEKHAPSLTRAQALLVRDEFAALRRAVGLAPPSSASASASAAAPTPPGTSHFVAFAVLWSMYRQWRRAGGDAESPISVVANAFLCLTGCKTPRLAASDEAYCLRLGFRLFDDARGADLAALARAFEAGDASSLFAGL